MRKTFFDVLENISEESEIKSEYWRVQELFSLKEIWINGEKSTIQNYIDKNEFLNWKYRKTCLNIEDMAETYNLPFDWDEVTLEDFFLYLEFVLNLILLIKNKRWKEMQQTINLLENNITLFLDKYNHKIFQTSDKIIIIPKSEIVSELAILNEDIAPNIIEYQSISIKGNVKHKRELILGIAQKYEGIENKLKKEGHITLVNNIGCLLNNLHLRHNNKIGKKANDIVKDIPDDELEKWYDKTYDMLLLSIMTENCIKYKQDIDELCLALKK